MAQVSLENVTKEFGDVVAVNDMTLEARDKEFLVLVGPSGCGKTTTLRMIAGLDEITAGTISIGERVVNKLSPKDRDIAMVFQSYALYPHMNVFNNMAFGLKIRHTPKTEIQQRVKEAARILEIEPLMKRKPKELSGGQRQRVALGRAIVRHPSVFLMDEPLSNLDAMLRVQTRKELVSLYRRLETTVIYVTHDQTEAMTMGTRIAVMNGGYLQQADSPQALYDFPVNTFVASFIGSPQMNMIEGNLVSQGGATIFQAGSIAITLPPSVAQAAGRTDTSKAILGVRPEHVTVTTGPDAAADSVRATVDLVEHMGAELHVYLQAGPDTNLTARLSPEQRIFPGSDVTLQFDMRQIHLFDGQSLDAIAHAATEPGPPPAEG